MFFFKKESREKNQWNENVIQYIYEIGKSLLRHKKNKKPKVTMLTGTWKEIRDAMTNIKMVTSEAYYLIPNKARINNVKTSKEQLPD